MTTIRQIALDLIHQATDRSDFIGFPLTFLRLVKNDHKAAILLNQIMYWTERTKDDDGWFYKSYLQWETELGLSESEVRRIIKGDPRSQKRKCPLVDLGVETCVRRAPNGSPTVHYRIDQAVFVAVLVDFLEANCGFKPGRFALANDCTDSIPNIAQDGPAATQRMDPVESHDSSLTETHDPKNHNILESPVTAGQKPEKSGQKPPSTAQDDDFLKRFGGLFGELSQKMRGELMAHVERLGQDTAHEVVNRCVGKARTWRYVLVALKNEATPIDPAEAIRQSMAGWVAVATPDDVEPAAEAVPVTEAEIQTKTTTAEQPASEPAVQAAESTHKSAPRVMPTLNQPLGRWESVSRLWQVAEPQLRYSLDSMTYHLYLRHAVLVDYAAASKTFTIVVHADYAREKLQHRLYELVRRLLAHVAFEPDVQIQFETAASWAARCAHPVQQAPGAALMAASAM